ncbi:hypothetical protein AB0J38_24990 [Streptomyces sp. NPDC050095]|uniref:hypothetical protein n=1 Tax=unclassified Streptomyces TaxID=2593676 RepID=UPI003412948A
MNQQHRRWSAIDTVTPNRRITHQHFAVGDTVTVIRGVADGVLCGEEMRIVAPSWHEPTKEDGWRVRNPKGGRRTYLTAHPRYLVHTAKSRRHCPDCTLYLKDLSQTVLSQLPATGIHEAGWYRITEPPNHLLHNADEDAAK